MTSRATRAAVVATGTALSALLVVGPAAAHSTAVASWPARGEVVVATPDRVTVQFSTDVMPQVDVAVVGPHGESVALGEPVTDGPYVTQRLRPSEDGGGYVAAFHVVAADLHPILTRVEFEVDPGGRATANPAGAPPELDTDEGPAAVEDAAEPQRASSSSSGQLPLVVGLVVVVTVAVAIRLVVARRAAPG